MKEIYRKIQKVKMELEPISKDITNEYYNSKYFDINKLLYALEGLFISYDLLLLQPIINGNVVTTIIDLESDQKIESSLKLPELDNPQKIGGAITYYRRYSLASLMGIIGEDDDANKASQQDSAPASIDSDDKSWISVGGPAWIKAISKKMTLKELRTYYKVSVANGDKYEKELKNEV